MKKSYIVVMLVSLLTSGFCNAAAMLGPVAASNDRTLDTANSHPSDEETLMARGKASATYSRKSWIRFDLSGQQYFTNAPAEFKITYVDSPSYAGRLNISVLKAGFVPSSTNILGVGWEESDINWNNAPGNTTNSPYVLNSADVNVLYTKWLTNNVNIAAGDVITVSIDTLSDYIQTNETVTVVMTSYDYAVGTRAFFASSENTNTAYSVPTLTPTRPEGTVVTIK